MYGEIQSVVSSHVHLCLCPACLLWHKNIFPVDKTHELTFCVDISYGQHVDLSYWGNLISFYAGHSAFCRYVVSSVQIAFFGNLFSVVSIYCVVLYVGDLSRRKIGQWMLLHSWPYISSIWNEYNQTTHCIAGQIIAVNSHSSVH